MIDTDADYGKVWLSAEFGAGWPPPTRRFPGPIVVQYAQNPGSSTLASAAVRSKSTTPWVS